MDVCTQVAFDSFDCAKSFLGIFKIHLWIRFLRVKLKRLQLRIR